MKKKNIIIILVSVVFSAILFGALGFLLGSNSIENEVSNKPHSHMQYEVGEYIETPDVELELFADKKDGYNAKINLTNFEFSPEEVNTDYTANQGHSHIYVNGVKVGRVYSEWIHLPDRYFDQPRNFVKVTLNADDHSELFFQQKLIEDTIVIEK